MGQTVAGGCRASPDLQVIIIITHYYYKYNMFVKGNLNHLVQVHRKGDNYGHVHIKADTERSKD